MESTSVYDVVYNTEVGLYSIHDVISDTTDFVDVNVFNNFVDSYYPDDKAKRIKNYANSLLTVRLIPSDAAYGREHKPLEKPYDILSKFLSPEFIAEDISIDPNNILDRETYENLKRELLYNYQE